MSDVAFRFVLFLCLEDIKPSLIIEVVNGLVELNGHFAKSQSARDVFAEDN